MSGRLTERQRADRRLTEREWQRQLTDLAEALGWSWVHFRPAQTARGWRTPVEGPLGAGWPDLILVGRGRVVLVELKRELGQPAPGQDWVHDLLRANGCELYVWRPSDLEDAARVLGDVQRPALVRHTVAETAGRCRLDGPHSLEECGMFDTGGLDNRAPGR